MPRRSIAVAIAAAVSVAATVPVTEAVAASGRARHAKPHPAARGAWVTAWAAASQGPSTAANFGAETFSGHLGPKLVQKLVGPPATFTDQTVRQLMYLHHAGSRVRLRLSNQFTNRATTLPAITIGRLDGTTGAAIRPGTERAVTFNGSRSVTMAPGGHALSDVVKLPVDRFDTAVLSIYVPKGNPAATVHGNAQQTFFVASGDRTAQVNDGGYAERGLSRSPVTATATTATYYADRIEVLGDRNARTLVTLGDSITDGFFSSGNVNHRYPDYLAHRLAADPATSDLSVANQAISGGRVLHDSFGPRIIDRLPTEVFDQPDLAGVIYLQGINDIGTSVLSGRPATAAELIQGYRDLAAAVHAHGIPIYIATLTPAGDALKPAPYGLYSSPIANRTRDEVNRWMKGAGRQAFDGVIDMDAATRDPRFPNHLRLAYDSVDALHPNDAGYHAMAQAIPLDVLRALARGRTADATAHPDSPADAVGRVADVQADGRGMPLASEALEELSGAGGPPPRTRPSRPGELEQRRPRQSSCAIASNPGCDVARGPDFTKGGALRLSATTCRAPLPARDCGSEPGLGSAPRLDRGGAVSVRPS
jgi:lysophospholipase L1-like esterase